MIPVAPLVVDPRPWHERFRGAVRHPITWVTDISGGGPVYALAILFGLSMVDEMDRDAFGLLIPNIRDAFHMSDAGILSLVAIAALLGLALTVPIAQLADSRNRVRLMLIGATVFAIFSFGTGLAMFVWVLCIMRGGTGVGQATVLPDAQLAAGRLLPHRGPAPRLLVPSRCRNAVGAFIGPLLAGCPGRLVQLAGPVPRPRRADAHPRRARPPAGRAGARRAGARGHGHGGRRAAHRGAASVVRRVVAHGLEGREPAPHLLRPALPGRLPHRVRVAGRRSCTSDSSGSTTVHRGPTSRRSPSRCSSSGCSSAPGTAPS